MIGPQLRYAAIMLAALGGASCSPPSGGSPDAGSSAECVAPTNPWNGDGGGHEAGFKWAQETGGECGSSNSESFDEGCNEFHRQRRQYDECVAAKAR